MADTQITFENIVNITKKAQEARLGTTIQSIDDKIVATANNGLSYLVITEEDDLTTFNDFKVFEDSIVNHVTENGFKIAKGLFGISLAYEISWGDDFVLTEPVELPEVITTTTSTSPTTTTTTTEQPTTTTTTTEQFVAPEL